ncbi:AraC family transcriptional regulator [Paenibacillus sp. N4]|uniref:AraC family transcriptional regulator n=1 Tax=Paenibacillus vietnamensis TaxID=2590547 RepID=UPI001CD101B1|nr:AraC family transcriptional regulator [Paenibacillus vietnamensis]MCA0756930.1 AraC family transcriptional regulator [Paenibacillus vietnamensis]
MSGPAESNDSWDSLIAEVYEAALMEADGSEECAPASPLSSFMLIYCDKGRGELRFGNQTASLTRHALYLLHPGTAYHIKPEQGASVKWYMVRFDLYRAVERSEQRRLYERQLHWAAEGSCGGPHSRIKQQLVLLTRQEREMSAPIRRLQRQQYVMELLQLIEPADTAGGSGEPQELWLQQALRYIQEHYHREIRVEALAEIAGLHPVYFSQQFKRHMHKSPSAYMTELRINRAKELLLVTDKNMREVAQFVGYRDEFYFSRRFKESTGVPPTAYVKQASPSVISLSYPCTDHLYTLGVHPRAAQLHESFDFHTEELRLPMHGSEAWEAGRDTFLALRPDLILCKDNLLRKAREHIGDIAPILSIPWVNMDVFGHLKQIALMVDRKLNAQLWLDRFRQQEEQGRKAIRQKAGGAVLAICVLRENGLRMYSTRNVGHVFYRSLQLQMPDRIRRETEKHEPGTGFNWLKLEPEELTDYDADILLLLVRSDGEKARMERVLAEDPVWRRHTAVRTKRYLILDWNQWMVYAPSSLERQLESAVRLLTGMS